jgi:hypothetical protein
MKQSAEYSLASHAQITAIESGRLLLPNCCTAIRPNGNDEFIPVTPSSQPECKPGNCVWEYTDSRGNVWGWLTNLEPHTESPAWQINSTAGQGTGKEFYENHYPVSGDGTMHVWYGHGTWMSDGMRELTAGQEAPVLTMRGDTYQLRAGNLGMSVLTLCPEVPFLDMYEEQTTAPQLRAISTP